MVHCFGNFEHSTFLLSAFLLDTVFGCEKHLTIPFTTETSKYLECSLHSKWSIHFHVNAFFVSSFIVLLHFSFVLRSWSFHLPLIYSIKMITVMWRHLLFSILRFVYKYYVCNIGAYWMLLTHIGANNTNSLTNTQRTFDRRSNRRSNVGVYVPIAEC